MIGVFGGTFDPVHFGHLRPALEVKLALGLRKILLIPCRQPPHRAQPMASAEQRLAMLKQAAADVDGFVVDQRELDRDGPSYMVDTLQSLREEFPEESLALILGMDAFLGLESWHHWQELLQLANLVVCQRPGALPQFTPSLANVVAQHQVDSAADLLQQNAGAILFQQVTQLEISATQIRKVCAQGESIRYLVPESVRAYIEQNGLYMA